MLNFSSILGKRSEIIEILEVSDSESSSKKPNTATSTNDTYIEKAKNRKKSKLYKYINIYKKFILSI